MLFRQLGFGWFTYQWHLLMNQGFNKLHRWPQQCALLFIIDNTFYLGTTTTITTTDTITTVATATTTTFATTTTIITTTATATTSSTRKPTIG
jgi:hypothetical protein